MDILNKGKEPGDLFEEEIHNCDTTEGEFLYMYKSAMKN